MDFIKVNKGKTIILSSKSPRRKQLLQETGLNFKIKTFPTNEDYPVELKGREIPEFLVKKKAIPFNKIKKNEIIITADTIVWAKSEHLGKPKDILEAKKFLEKLSNKKHEVITSVCFTEKEWGLVLNGNFAVRNIKEKLDDTEYTWSVLFNDNLYPKNNLVVVVDNPNHVMSYSEMFMGNINDD